MALTPCVAEGESSHLGQPLHNQHVALAKNIRMGRLEVKDPDSLSTRTMHDRYVELATRVLCPAGHKDVAPGWHIDIGYADCLASAHRLPANPTHRCLDKAVLYHRVAIFYSSITFLPIEAVAFLLRLVGIRGVLPMAKQ